jgi:hypothetical protein
MWMITKVGLFSIVAHRADSEIMIVRARDRKHLSLLSNLNPTGKLEILDSPDADYPCRVIMDKARWMVIAEWLVYKIDYTNFKNTCSDCCDLPDNYIAFLHDVWTLGRDLTPPKQRAKA